MSNAGNAGRCCPFCNSAVDYTDYRTVHDCECQSCGQPISPPPGKSWRELQKTCGPFRPKPVAPKQENYGDDINEILGYLEEGQPAKSPSSRPPAPVATPTEQSTELNSGPQGSWSGFTGNRSPTSTSTVLAVAMFSIVGLCAGCCLLPYMSSSNNSEPSSAEASAMAKQFVRDQLLSPSSAKFGWEAPIVTASDDGKSFSVSGKVGAKNAFGVEIEHNYYCRLRYNGDGNWACESVELSP